MAGDYCTLCSSFHCVHCSQTMTGIWDIEHEIKRRDMMAQQNRSIVDSIQHVHWPSFVTIITDYKSPNKKLLLLRSPK